MTREQALAFVKQLIKNPNLIKHMLAVEAEMRALAQHFEEDQETWGLVGLLHDADYELTQNDPPQHTLITVEKLKPYHLNQVIIDTILSHNHDHTHQGHPPQSTLEWSLYTCDDLSGLIIAVALVRPDKKLASVTVDSILKKWGQKSFAAGADRSRIQLCQDKLSIKLEDFISLCLKAVQSISPDLGL